MRAAILVLAVAGSMGLASAPVTQVRAAPALVPHAGEPALAAEVQPVWYDRFGRWQSPYYRYGYGPPPGYYAYGPAQPYWRHRYWHRHRFQCLHFGYC